MATRTSGGARLAPKFDVDNMLIDVNVATGTQSGGDYETELVLQLDLSQLPDTVRDTLLLQGLWTLLGARTSDVKDSPRSKAYEMAAVVDLWNDGELKKEVVKLSADDKRLGEAVAFKKRVTLATAYKTIRALEPEQKEALRKAFKDQGVFKELEDSKSGTVDLSDFGV